MQQNNPPAGKAQRCSESAQALFYFMLSGLRARTSCAQADRFLAAISAIRSVCAFMCADTSSSSAISLSTNTSERVVRLLAALTRHSMNTQPAQNPKAQTSAASKAPSTGRSATLPSTARRQTPTQTNPRSRVGQSRPASRPRRVCRFEHQQRMRATPAINHQRFVVHEIHRKFSRRHFAQR